MADLFVYGTLMLPACWEEQTCSALPPQRPAVLPHWRRRLVRGRTYPGIVPDPREEVAGLLYLGIPAATLRRLDTYEGEEYRRVRLPVLVEGRRRPADCYILRHPRLLGHGVWSVVGA